jgi:hypothetical protein
MNLDFINTEALIVEPDQQGGFYSVVGVAGGEVMTSNPRYKALRASRMALQIAKNALGAGKAVKVPTKTPLDEVLPSDLVVADAGDELEAAKRVAASEINSAITQNAVCASAIDAFGFIAAFSRLADHGVFITDENREEKYFEVIDKAQQTENPAEPLSGASYAEEQEYLDKKKKYAFAQSTLEALEQYLVEYDRIKPIYYFDKKAREAVSEVFASQTVEEVSAAKAKFEELAASRFSTGA